MGRAPTSGPLYPVPCLVTQETRWPLRSKGWEADNSVLAARHCHCPHRTAQEGGRARCRRESHTRPPGASATSGSPFRFPGWHLLRGLGPVPQPLPGLLWILAAAPEQQALSSRDVLQSCPYSEVLRALPWVCRSPSSQHSLELLVQVVLVPRAPCLSPALNPSLNRPLPASPTLRRPSCMWAATPMVLALSWEDLAPPLHSTSLQMRFPSTPSPSGGVPRSGP